MNLWNGTRLFLAREHRWAEDFQAFLELIHYHYRGMQALLLDETPATRRLAPCGWWVGTISSCCGCRSGARS